MYFEIYRDTDQQYRWRLIAGNGRVVAVAGEGYKNRAGCLKGIKCVQRSAEAEFEEVEGENS